MRTDELIESLVHEAKPVRRWPRPGVLALGVVLGAVAVSMAGAWLMGIRPDFGMGLLNRRFIMINTMLLLALAGVAFVLSRLSVPSRQRMRIQVIFGAVVLAVLIGMFLMRWPWFYPVSWGLWLTWGWQCAVRTVLLGGLPTVAGLWLHRHGAPMNPAISGGLIGGAAGTQGANAMGWACEVEEPMHVMLFHFLVPTMLLALAGWWAGRRWLRW